MWNQIFKPGESPAASELEEQKKRLGKHAEMRRPGHLPKILLIDDDPIFGKIMKNAAAHKGAPITYCCTLEEFAGLDHWDFDIAIVDFDLGAVTGLELTAYMSQFLSEEVPVILVSQTKHRNSKEWPGAIREFVHKNVGPFAILDAAFEAFEIASSNKETRNKNVTH